MKPSVFRLSVQPKLRFTQVDAVAPGDAVSADIHLDLAEERFVRDRGKWLLIDQRTAVIDFVLAADKSHQQLLARQRRHRFDLGKNDHLHYLRPGSSLYSRFFHIFANSS